MQGDILAYSAHKVIGRREMWEGQGGGNPLERRREGQAQQRRRCLFLFVPQVISSWAYPESLVPLRSVHAPSMTTCTLPSPPRHRSPSRAPQILAPVNDPIHSPFILYAASLEGDPYQAAQALAANGPLSNPRAFAAAAAAAGASAAAAAAAAGGAAGGGGVAGAGGQEGGGGAGEAGAEGLGSGGGAQGAGEGAFSMPPPPAPEHWTWALRNAQLSDDQVGGGKAPCPVFVWGTGWFL